MVRQESWINEGLRINSCTAGITEVKSGYSQLYAIKFSLYILEKRGVRASHIFTHFVRYLLRGGF